MSSSPSVIYTVYCVKCGAAANASHEWGTWLCYPCTRYEDGLRAAEAALAEIENDPDAQVDYDRDYTADPSGSTRNPRIWLRSAIDAIRALKESK